MAQEDSYKRNGDSKTIEEEDIKWCKSIVACQQCDELVTCYGIFFICLIFEVRVC